MMQLSYIIYYILHYNNIIYNVILFSHEKGRNPVIYHMDETGVHYAK